MKKLYRTTGSKQMVSGVLGGLGEYFNVDATLLRVAFVFFVLVTGIFPGVIAYIIAIFLMPAESDIVVEVRDVEHEEKE